jgi:Skp family chaperone for outer membrane proteins
MEQHPIPQQISSYEFQLVGNMTLRQFFKLAGGLLVAFLFYSTGLPFIFKWPLIIGSAGLGIALAFMPVNNQPLEKWIFAFFKSVYSPTVYLWQKQSVTIDILSNDFEQPLEPIQTQPEEPVDEDKEPQLKEFLKSLPDKDKGKEEKDEKRKGKEEKKKVQAKEQQESKQSKEQEEKSKKKPKINLDLPERQAPKATGKAEFGDIPMPSKPKTPNIVVGMVTNGEGKIIENVIIEIQDNEGNPVRALRTNQLGQFKTATPLSNGKYLIMAEKEGYDFDILELETQGEVIKPLKIKAKNNNNA